MKKTYEKPTVELLTLESVEDISTRYEDPNGDADNTSGEGGFEEW